MITQLEHEVTRYNAWKTELIAAIEEYRGWLESAGQLEDDQAQRFLELSGSLHSGRLMLAFIAEFSRGKTELINALFFSDFKQRLLPSDVGRTTMCPTEIFHDADSTPYLRLLPIETRYRDEPIAQLKSMPAEWTTISLDLDSAREMKTAMGMLAACKRVYPLEAKMMGFIGDTDSVQHVGGDGLIEIPAWRYALVNYPHPLLTQGLTILDTPGLNALGLEPELTLATLPSAHAALFLLAVDTRVTRSDMEVSQRSVKDNVAHRI